MLHNDNDNDNDSPKTQLCSRPALGLIGFGAFGRLAAEHLRPFFELRVYDPALTADSPISGPGITATSLAVAAACPVVVIATPVNRLDDTIAALAAHVRPGALVLDVGSVKMLPAAVMTNGLPAGVDIVATHPLFGPQSARDGIAGHKIALCPLRGRRGRRVAAFLRKQLRLEVILTTPEAHDRELALVQGLTHLIARVLVQMEPLPRSMTTRSFDLLVEAIGMVRHDAPGVFDAIERANPFSPAVRRRFIELAGAMQADLDGSR